MDTNPDFIEKFESFSPFDFTNNLGSNKSHTKFERLKLDLISYFKVREDKIDGVDKTPEISNSPSSTSSPLSTSKVSDASSIQSTCSPYILPCNPVGDEFTFSPLTNSGENINSVQITSCSTKNPSTLDMPWRYAKKVNATKINPAKSLFDNFHEEFGLENITEYEEIDIENDNILVNLAFEEINLESDESDNECVINNENISRITTPTTCRSVGKVGKHGDTIEVTDAELLLYKKTGYKHIKKSNTRLKYIIPTCMGKILLRCIPADYQDERRQVIGRTNKAAAALRLYPEEPRGRWGRHRSVASIQGSPYFLQLIATRISKIQQFSGEDVSIHLFKYNQIRNILEEHDIQLKRISIVDTTQ